METGTGGARLEVEAELGALNEGASIACSGVCMTVVRNGPDWFAVDASNETLARTTVSGWSAGTRINLERPLRVGDELGGHFVLGHVDGVAEIAGRAPDGDSVRLAVEAPAALAPYIAEKGSVTLDGVSLTMTDVSGTTFGVNVIPHTLAATTLGDADVGTRLNLEVDMLARTVARLREGGV